MWCKEHKLCKLTPAPFFGFLNKLKNSKMFYKNVREECIRKLGIAELSGSSVCCYGRSDYLNLTTVLINRDRAS